MQQRPPQINIAPNRTLYYHWIESPLDKLLLTATEQSLTGLFLQDQKYFPAIAPDWQAQPELPPFLKTQQQLEEYFRGDRQTFDLPLAPAGTTFQQQVWQQLRQIPFGQTWSYGDLAQAIGQPSAARAVGAANGRNPISIIVPCHRVIASNSKLTGYAGGVDRKQWLLNHERSQV
jgi:methylated-DNA-[protein]-cysteine S-methyltransferase